MIGGWRNSGRAAAVLAVAAALGGVVLLACVNSARAASSCSGALIDSRNLVVHGSKVGELDVYYDSASGRNCAKMNHAGSTWGKRLYTEVSVARCRERSAVNQVCNATAGGYDPGMYRYYAGPVSVPARGHCIVADGAISIGGKERWVYTGVSHCGR